MCKKEKEKMELEWKLTILNRDNFGKLGFK